MIRLRSTVLSISVNEIQDYDERRQERNSQESIRKFSALPPKPSIHNDSEPALSNVNASQLCCGSMQYSKKESQSPPRLVEKLDNMHLGPHSETFGFSSTKKIT